MAQRLCLLTLEVDIELGLELQLDMVLHVKCTWN